jgi:hypothetical protein
MAIRNKEPFSGSVAGRQRPIQCVTENGFSIIRRSEVETCEVSGTTAGPRCSSRTDTAHECHFLVHNPSGWERDVTVEFDDGVIAGIENLRRSHLSLTSGFWLSCAERCLATYLWENDGYPPGGQLTITELCIDELLLAEHWRD